MNDRDIEDTREPAEEKQCPVCDDWMEWNWIVSEWECPTCTHKKGYEDECVAR